MWDSKAKPMGSCHYSAFTQLYLMLGNSKTLELLKKLPCDILCDPIYLTNANFVVAITNNLAHESNVHDKIYNKP